MNSSSLIHLQSLNSDLYNVNIFIISGIIFEKQTEEIQQAFKFAVLNHNRDINKKFELLGSVDIINTADVFKLTGLSKLS